MMIWSLPKGALIHIAMRIWAPMLTGARAFWSMRLGSQIRGFDCWSKLAQSVLFCYRFIVWFSDRSFPCRTDMSWQTSISQQHCSQNVWFLMWNEARQILFIIKPAKSRHRHAYKLLFLLDLIWCGTVRYGMYGMVQYTYSMHSMYRSSGMYSTYSM